MNLQKVFQITDTFHIQNVICTFIENIHAKKFNITVK